MIKNYMKQRGALLIEYGLILAFIVTVGALFISDNGISNSISGIFGKSSETIEMAVNGGKANVKTYGTGKGLSVEWLESDFTQGLLSSVRMTYPNLATNSYENLDQDNFLKAISKELGLNPNDVTYTLNDNGKFLMYSVHEGTDLTPSYKVVKTTVVEFNNTGTVQKISTFNASYQTFQVVQGESCKEPYKPYIGFWNKMETEEILYTVSK